jgi:hypothetical protein
VPTVFSLFLSQHSSLSLYLTAPVFLLLSCSGLQRIFVRPRAYLTSARSQHPQPDSRSRSRNPPTRCSHSHSPPPFSPSPFQWSVLRSELIFARVPATPRPVISCGLQAQPASSYHRANPGMSATVLHPTPPVQPYTPGMQSSAPQSSQPGPPSVYFDNTSLAVLLVLIAYL